VDGREQPRAIVFWTTYQRTILIDPAADPAEPPRNIANRRTLCADSSHVLKSMLA